MSHPEIGISDLLERGPAPGNVLSSRREGLEQDVGLEGPGLTVSVAWGDLVEVQADLHATGHYQGVTPSAAERALDRAISSSGRQVIAEHNRRGWIDAKLGKVSYFPCKAGPVRSAAVVGMGRMGSFTERRAARLYESLLGELLSLDHVSKAAIVLIGSGAGNLQVRQAAQALIRGFDAALKAVSVPPGQSVPIDVVVVEIDRLRADKVHRALRESVEGVPRIQVANDLLQAGGGKVGRASAAVFAVVELARLARSSASPAGDDGRTGDPADEGVLGEVLANIGDEGVRDRVREKLAEIADIDPTDLSVITHVNPDPAQESLPVNISVLRSDKGLRWAALAERATVPEREVRIDQDLLRQLVERLTEPSIEDARELPDLLSRLVVPLEFQWLVSDEAPVVLELDRTTAIVPWEFLADIQQDVGRQQSPLAVRTPISRNLRTQYSSVNVAEELSGGPPQALIIADPGDPAQGMDLEGARDEARAVKNVLCRNGVNVRALIGAPNFDKREADEDPATRIDVLRALLSGRYHIVHYCGHGTFDDSGPSGWVFADGLLTAQELAQLARPPRIVVANACYSAKVKPAVEGVFKVADEFLRAGVVHYVGAAWRIPDAQGRAFAQSFYETLLDSAHTVGDAVQAARRRTFNARSGRQMGTGFDEAKSLDHHRWNAWAAYQHYGDPTDRFRGTTED
ncbi:CHAT domain-containing protein [Streptomyces sp. NPDC001514]